MRKNRCATVAALPQDLDADLGLLAYDSGSILGSVRTYAHEMDALAGSLCGQAVGAAIPSLVIWNGSKLHCMPRLWAEGGRHGERGWSTDDTFVAGAGRARVSGVVGWRGRWRSGAGSSCAARTAFRARWSRPSWVCTTARWAMRRRRFLKDRVNGLLDEARPGRPRTIDGDQIAGVIERMLRTTPAMLHTGRSGRWRARVIVPR